MLNRTAGRHFSGIGSIYWTTLGETNSIYYETNNWYRNERRPLPSQGVLLPDGDVRHKMIKEYKATLDVQDRRVRRAGP